MAEPAVILAPGALSSIHGKVVHGLVRSGSRFQVVAVVDPEQAGQDAGTVVDGKRRGIPVLASLEEALQVSPRPTTCVQGVSSHGGRLTDSIRAQLLHAVDLGLSVVCGLHDFVCDDPEIARRARERGVSLTDVRKPRPRSELRFWSGDIRHARAPRIAVLGMDCAIGKRTACRMLLEVCQAAGIRCEMIYTGQTGWMQGADHGFILDSTVNDYVSGELERAVLECDRAKEPDLILLEGQSALRNPSGPCGAELLVSAQAKGVILIHAPGRESFEGHDGHWPIPPLEEEIRLIELYGANVIAVALNEGEITGPRFDANACAERIGVPVVRPLEGELEMLVPQIRAFLRVSQSTFADGNRSDNES